MNRIHEQLLRGKPVKVDKTQVTLPTLDEIFDLGLDKYLEYLQAIILDISSLELNLDIFEGEEFSDYEIFLLLILTNKDLKNTFFEAMLFFTGDPFVLEEQTIFSLKKQKIDGKDQFTFHQIMDEKFWVSIRKVLTLAHWQEDPKKYSYASAKAKAIMEKIRKNKEEVQKIKSKKGEGSLELYELIGSVSTHSKSYNLFNIWNLTYYQFFDHYYRLNINDNYHFSLQSILAGADPKKVNIEHWASSIKKN